MAVTRIKIDLIFDSVDNDKVQSLWDAIKLQKEFFREIIPSNEQSTMEVHTCHHDETPLKPCETRKKIIMNNTISDEVL